MTSELPQRWEAVSLGEICDIFDGPHATPPTTDTGPIFLGIKNLDSGRLDLAETRHVSEEHFAQWTRRVTPSAGDVVFSYETRLGQAALIPPGLRCCLGRRMGLLRVRSPDVVSPEYLLLAYLGPQFQQVIRDRTISGSTVDRLPLNTMGSFEIVLPPREIQDRIVQIIGALDAKIETNERVARLADSCAGAIAHRWLDSREPVVRVDQVAEVVLGGTPSRNNASYWTNGTVPWVASGAVNEFRVLTPTELITDEALQKSAAKLMPAGTPVVAITGATCGRVSRLEITACANQSVVGLIEGPRAPSSLLYFWLQRSVPELMRHTTGAAQQHVNKGNVAALPYPNVEESDARSIAAQLDPLMALCAGLLSETRILRSIRDELLPKLVSGKIRAPAVEDIADAADGAALEGARAA